MRNRFNNITSKEWLPFQKSWFFHQSDEALYRSNLRFFMRLDGSLPKHVLYWGDPEGLKQMRRVCRELGITLHGPKARHVPALQFIFLDLRQMLDTASVTAYRRLKDEVVGILERHYAQLIDRRFLAVAHRNLISRGRYLPFAWDLSQTLATGLSRKDEKIGCYPDGRLPSRGRMPFVVSNYYLSYFRKDEESTGRFRMDATGYLGHEAPPAHFKPDKNYLILRPKRRGQDEILHPAKFPEEIARYFIEKFSLPGDNIFDPMSGTCSTQLAALQTGRNGYGTELSDFFLKIGRKRLSDFPKGDNVTYRVIRKDARKITKRDFPPIDYVFTSPPYWDMLNMKGAENQAARKARGLQLNYSDDRNDLGNIADYETFVRELRDIYFRLWRYMKPGAHLTIIVKNIKKKGKRYPLAFDLARQLAPRFYLLPEFFWLQDDQRLAPYGYGYTWVSNTFHQYCLTFRKRPDE